jgi:hypothetical protein
MVEAAHYLYRGTTRGWPGTSTTKLGEITPTSTDPLVAVLFAIEGRNKGRAVLLAVRRGAFSEMIDENYFSTIESAVNLAVSPADFANRADVRTEIDRAIHYLESIGFGSLPQRIQGNSGLHEVLAETHLLGIRLTPGQIRRFNALMLEASLD